MAVAVAPVAPVAPVVVLVMTVVVTRRDNAQYK
jgi:hypothetical protein